MLYVLSPVLGLAAYVVYMQVATGDALAMVHAQALFPVPRGLDNLTDPRRFVDDFLTVKLAFHDTTGSLLDRVFFIAFVASLLLAYRKLDRPLFAFVLLMGLTPLAGSFMAFMRYLVVAWPLFLAWGRYLNGKSPRLMFYGLLPLLALQEIFVILYATYNGVA
ncbi:MAG: hypothetical protein GEU75_00875 [Dehalococcoidia bacterium]|nr:hypothetical protein [Dehalococcoidia bacterium]